MIGIHFVHTYVMYWVESESGVTRLEGEDEEVAGVLPLFPCGGVILPGDFDCARRGVVSLSTAS